MYSSPMAFYTTVETSASTYTFFLPMVELVLVLVGTHVPVRYQIATCIPVSLVA